MKAWEWVALIAGLLIAVPAVGAAVARLALARRRKRGRHER